MTLPEWAAPVVTAVAPALGVAAGAVGGRTAAAWGRVDGLAISADVGGWAGAGALAATAVVAAFVALAAFPGWWALAAFALALSFIYAGAVDLKCKLLPDAPTWAAAALGVAWSGALAALLGALVAGGGLAVLRWGMSRRLRREAMGWGDVQLAAAGGALLGPVAVWTALSVAAIAAMAVALMVRRAREEIPFGPALLSAFWLAWAARAAGLGPAW